MNIFNEIRVSIKNVFQRKMFLVLFVFLSFSVLCKYLAITKESTVYIQYNLYFELLLCIPLFCYAQKNINRLKIRYNSQWYQTFRLFLIIEFLVGIVYSGVLSFIVGDTAFWIFFLALFFLGMSREFWRFFFPFGLVIAIFTSFLSIQEISSGAMTYLRDAFFEDSYLYKINQGLAPIAMVAIYYTLLKKKYYALLSIVIFVFFIALQFFFQKRLPLLRCSLYVVFFFFVLKHSFSTRKRIGIIIISIIVLLVGLFFVPSELSSATIDRFFESGSISKTTQNDDRYLIAAKVVDETLSNPRSILVGQGIGGFLLGDYCGKTIIINGKTTLGIIGFEIGSATLLFKYGVIFFFLYFGYIFRLLLQYKKYLKDPLTMSCWVYLMVYFMMTLIGESLPDVDTPLVTCMVAGSIGWLSSSNSKNRKLYKSRL